MKHIQMMAQTREDYLRAEAAGEMGVVVDYGVEVVHNNGFLIRATTNVAQEAASHYDQEMIGLAYEMDEDGVIGQLLFAIGYDPNREEFSVPEVFWSMRH